jgi:four helix bundle protein
MIGRMLRLAVCKPHCRRVGTPTRPIIPHIGPQTSYLGFSVSRRQYGNRYVIGMKLRRIEHPREEAYRLTAQIRRAASSIPSNIAEGCRRDGDTELARFCIIARGSASELEYQLLLARDLKLLQPTTMNNSPIRLSRSNACSESWFRS